MPEHEPPPRDRSRRDDGPVSWYAELVETHFARALRPTTRPTQRERALELFLLSVLSDLDSLALRRPRDAMFAADELRRAGHGIGHRFDVTTNEHVIVLLDPHATEPAEDEGDGGEEDPQLPGTGR